MTKTSFSLIAATLLLTTNTYADETLEDITITSSNKLPTSIEQTTANVVVITEKDIEERGYQTVAQAISNVSGISISRAGGLGQNTSLFMRGSRSNKVLVLLDGMRLNDPSTVNNTAFLDNITTSNIAQIEIIKGGSSSIWGTNASAGVINIITKEAKAGLHGSVGLSYGSYNTKGAQAELSYKGEKLTAQLLASTLDTDGFSSLAPREAEDDAHTNKNINAKLGYVFNENNQIKFNLNHIESDTEYDLGLADDDISHIETEQSNAALSYLYKQDNYSATVNLNKGKYESENTAPFNTISTFKSDIEEFSLINAFDYSKGKTILGFDYKSIEGDSQYHSAFFDSVATVDYTNKSVFISNLYNFNENTLLETNLRYDDFNTFENKTTYKIGLSHTHDFLEGFKTSANYYTSYDVPSIFEFANASFGSELKPSYTKGFDITAKYKELLSLTYFNNTVEDEIVFNNATFSYTNTQGEEKFSGIEVESNYALPLDGLLFYANYTHLFNIEREDGTNHIRRAEDTLNASLDYYTSNNMHFGVAAQYIGDRDDAFFDSATFQTIPTNTGNYTIWNLHFNTKIMQNTDLSINARNIFDKDYQSVAGYASEGRSIYAKIKYSF